MTGARVEPAWLEALLRDVDEASGYDADAVLGVLDAAAQRAPGSEWARFLWAASHRVRSGSALAALALAERGAVARDVEAAIAAGALVALGAPEGGPIGASDPSRPILVRPDVTPEALHPDGDRVLDRDGEGRFGIRWLRSGRRLVLPGDRVRRDDRGGWFVRRDLHATFDPSGEIVAVVRQQREALRPSRMAAAAWRVSDGQTIGRLEDLPWDLWRALWLPGDDPRLALLTDAGIRGGTRRALAPALWAPERGAITFGERCWPQIREALAPIRVDLPDGTFLLADDEGRPLGQWRLRDGAWLDGLAHGLAAVSPDRRLAVQVAPLGRALWLVERATLDVCAVLEPPPGGWGWPEPCPAREWDWRQGVFRFVDDLLLGGNCFPEVQHHALSVWRLVDGGYEHGLGPVGCSAVVRAPSLGFPQPVAVLDRRRVALAVQGRRGDAPPARESVSVWDPRTGRRLRGLRGSANALFVSADRRHLIGVLADDHQPFESDLLRGIAIWDAPGIGRAPE